MYRISRTSRLVELIGLGLALTAGIPLYGTGCMQ